MTTTLEALELQAVACRRLGSNQYADLLDELAADHRAGGRTAALLDGRSPQPLHDALPLRLLGALHRAALSGRAPLLAARFASCGGDGGRVPLADLFATVDALPDEIDHGLRSQVQTNEVGRSNCLLAVANWLPTLGIEEFDLLEIGASAGLNLSFDRYGADTGDGVLGRANSPLVFESSTFARAPRVRTPALCVDRAGCDLNPVDPATDALRLVSFLWPDQLHRIARLRAAIEITLPLRHRVDRASADAWIAERLASRRSRATVIFHSIVWPYLPATAKERLRAAIVDAGQSGTVPLVWARMEPAGPRADLRADAWIGGVRTNHVLADVGYHGQEFEWREAL